MSNPASGTTYEFPERFADMTMHLGFLDNKEYASVDDYLAEQNYALAADLASKGFTAEQIESAVNAGRVAVAMWPRVEPKTHFFWAETDKAKEALKELAARTVELCYGQDEQAPVGGNFISVGAEIGSQQVALAGLIYAREQGKLREIAEMDEGAGPLYVVRDSFAGRMFDRLMPEEPAAE
jgi:hypothetical protein